MSARDEAAPLGLVQIALSGRKPFEQVRPWYVDGLGFELSGGVHYAGAHLASFTGMDVPMVDVDLTWLVGRSEFLQLEYFHFTEPEARPKPATWTPAHVGYSCFGVHVLDFDATLRRLAALGSVPVGPVVGRDGDRRASLLDPNGILVELLEQDVAPPSRPDPVRPAVNAELRFVRLSVDDLQRSRRFFGGALGLEPVAVELHAEEHEASWGLPGARPETEVLAAGSCFIELARYGDDLRRARPRDHRLSDEGILNVACGSADAGPVRQARERIGTGPYALHDDERSPGLECNYVTDDQGFSVELLYMDASRRPEYGFN